MKKLYILFLVLCTFFDARSQQLSTAFDTSLCGLDYVKGSTLITQRMSQYVGSGQPSPIIISGIPANTSVIKAFIWWDIAGDKKTKNDIIVKNPNNITDTFSGNIIGGGTNMCQGKGYSFRADVTNIISGNGTYHLSGLPSDTTFDFNNYSDANGATLMIIYGNPYAAFAGRIIIKDGYLKVSNDTIAETINNISVLYENDPSMGKAFMIVSDLEGAAGYGLQMNSGSFISYSQGFWDYEEKITIVLPQQSTSVFALRSPNDCSHLILAGLYFKQDTLLTPTPTITRNNDSLKAPSGIYYYQWYFNGSPISSATNPIYIADKSGNYHVEVGIQHGCYFRSDTINVITCSDQMKPNISVLLDSLWTDSTSYQLKWHLNGNPIPGAANPSHKAIAGGDYWVQAEDTITGCIANSDTIHISLATISTINDKFYVDVFPNPNDGSFTLIVNAKNLWGTEISLMSINGQVVFYNTLTDSSGNFRQTINLPLNSQGIYLLKIKNSRWVENKKLIVR